MILLLLLYENRFDVFRRKGTKHDNFGMEGHIRELHFKRNLTAPAKWANLSLRPCTGSSGGG